MRLSQRPNPTLCEESEVTPNGSAQGFRGHSARNPAQMRKRHPAGGLGPLGFSPSQRQETDASWHFPLTQKTVPWATSCRPSPRPQSERDLNALEGSLHQRCPEATREQTTPARRGVPKRLAGACKGTPQP